MLRLKFKEFPIYLVLLAGVFSSAAVQGNVYQKKDGLIIMKTENTPSNLGKWVLKTDSPEYNGKGFLEFRL